MKFRPATQLDQPNITRIIREANINPMSLAWRRFLVAEDDGAIVGVGQIKTHGDGSRELASIAVIPSYQGRGIARQIIQALIAHNPGVLYLTCRAQLEPFYARFGFRKIERAEMPPYFRRLIRIVNLIAPLVRGVQIIVMSRSPDPV